MSAGQAALWAIRLRGNQRARPFSPSGQCFSLHFQKAQLSSALFGSWSPPVRLKARAKKQQTEAHVREMSRPRSQGVEWWRLRPLQTPLQTSCHRVLNVRRKDKEKNPKVSIKCRYSLWLMKKCWVKIQRPTNLQLQGENTEIYWKKRKRSQVPEKHFNLLFALFKTKWRRWMTLGNLPPTTFKPAATNTWSSTLSLKILHVSERLGLSILQHHGLHSTWASLLCVADKTQPAQ